MKADLSTRSAHARTHTLKKVRIQPLNRRHITIARAEVHTSTTSAALKHVGIAISATAVQLAAAFGSPTPCLAQQILKSPIVSPSPPASLSLDKNILREPKHEAAKDSIQKPLPTEPNVIIPKEKPTETGTEQRSNPWIAPPDRPGAPDVHVVPPTPSVAPDPLPGQEPKPLPEGIPNTNEREQQGLEDTKSKISALADWVNSHVWQPILHAGDDLERLSSETAAYAGRQSDLDKEGGARAMVGTVVDAATEQLEEGLIKGGQVLKKGTQVMTQDALPVITAAMDVVKPYVKSAAEVSFEVASQLLAILSTFLDKLLRLLLDIPAMQRAHQQLSSWLAPITSTVLGPMIRAASNASANDIAAGVGAFLAIFAGIPLLNAMFRGYSGDISALAALTAVYNDADTVLVDIRTENDKSRQGSHNLPVKLTDRWLEVEYHTVLSKKTRQQLRDADLVEAQITALEISGNRFVAKRHKILLLDAMDTSRARTVARFLNKMGFNKVFVITGGFGGSQGWQQSKLPSKNWINTRQQLLKLLKHMEPVPGNGFHPPVQRVDDKSMRSWKD